ncbi:MAG: hypothetical protein KKD18_02260, partial [Nanoarchaeota archaeon]|nr:hypothetical protein [Nanoarchaeota archaeon]
MRKSETMKNAFWQLLVVYTALVVLISFSLVWKYTLHFELFAVVLAVLGALGLYHVQGEEEVVIPRRAKYLLLALGILLIVWFRVIPYMGNDIPLGYDAGIYKYGIENFAAKGFGSDGWVKSALTPGFLYLMYGLVKVGISSDVLLTLGFICFSVLLGAAIYLFAREYVGDKAAVIAVLLYAVSGIQFKLFSYLYYKNVIALSTLLFALYFYKRSRASVSRSAYLLTLKSGSHENRSQPKGGDWNGILFIVCGVLTGLMHRPTFFLFGVAYISLTVQDWKNFTRNFVDGTAILVLTLLLYAGFWESSILPLFVPVTQGFVEPGTAPGTFVSFFVYQFSTLYYLPFAILGFIHRFWQKKYDMLFFMTLIAGAIVYFQFFFFNRFVAHLDIFLIVLAGSGFSLLIDNRKKLGAGILVLMLLSAGYVSFKEAVSAEPLITEEGLQLIKMIDSNTSSDAKVIAISSEYSPWILAYSGRETIAPGLFDANSWSEQEWEL